VSGNARVSGDAQVSGNARVYGNALVSGNARVYGNALVSGNAWVFLPLNFDNPLVASLVNLGACSEALAWVGTRNIDQAWAECANEDWRQWLRMRGLHT
jgi:hypothetical protein